MGENNRLIVGTAQFGMQYGISNSNESVTFAETEQIVNQAKRAGITALDTAISYGEAENRLGKIGVSEWRIISKLPPLPNTKQSPTEWVEETFETCLTRLGVKHLYGFLLHRPLDLLKPEGEALYRTLIFLKETGLVQKIGVSVYSTKELESLMHYYSFDLVQVPLNVFNRQFQESGWLSRLHEANIEIHARSVFLQGLLLLDHQRRPKKFQRWSTLWTMWDKWLIETNCSPLQACLVFVLSEPAINGVIVGVDSVKQLNEICVLATSGSVVDIPTHLSTNEADLVDPSRWSRI